MGGRGARRRARIRLREVVMTTLHGSVSHRRAPQQRVESASAIQARAAGGVFEPYIALLHASISGDGVELHLPRCASICAPRQGFEHHDLSMRFRNSAEPAVEQLHHLVAVRSTVSASTRPGVLRLLRREALLYICDPHVEVMMMMCCGVIHRAALVVVQTGPRRATAQQDVESRGCAFFSSSVEQHDRVAIAPHKLSRRAVRLVVAHVIPEALPTSATALCRSWYSLMSMRVTSVVVELNRTRDARQLGHCPRRVRGRFMCGTTMGAGGRQSGPPRAATRDSRGRDGGPSPTTQPPVSSSSSIGAASRASEAACDCTGIAGPGAPTSLGHALLPIDLPP